MNYLDFVTYVIATSAAITCSALTLWVCRNVYNFWMNPDD